MTLYIEYQGRTIRRRKKLQHQQFMTRRRLSRCRYLATTILVLLLAVQFVMVNPVYNTDDDKFHSNDSPSATTRTNRSDDQIDTYKKTVSELVSKLDNDDATTRSFPSLGTKPLEAVTPPSTRVPPQKRVLRREKMNAFLKWCQQVQGIQTLLRIEDFEYIGYLSELSNADNDDAYYLDESSGKFEKSCGKKQHVTEKTTVRGLAATRLITPGEIVISIPFYSLLTLLTTIDHDPVLSRILGPEARIRHDWEGPSYEIPLMIVAILYHASLGSISPLCHYIELLRETPVESMPFLWEESRLRQLGQEGVRKLARGIKGDVRDMYESVMGVLILEHGNIFGRNAAVVNYDEQEKINTGAKEKEWMYSFENFQWAFAVVNSRHWHLPVADLDDHSAVDNKEKVQNPNLVKKGVDENFRQGVEIPDPGESFLLATVAGGVPPAQQPTDNWILEQVEVEKRDDEGAVASSSLLGSVEARPKLAIGRTDVENSNAGVQKHSFLAPLADLLNLGPPCTTGVYNAKTRAFEVVATCAFLEGQEVTFWYSDDCEDVIIANYGFTHPMVPRCLSLEEWQTRSEKWKNHARDLNEALDAAYTELNESEKELEYMRDLVQKCECKQKRNEGKDKRKSVVDNSRTPEESQQQQQPQEQQISVGQQTDLHEDVGIRGHRHGNQDHGGDRNGGHGGIRRTYQRLKDDLGL